MPTQAFVGGSSPDSVASYSDGYVYSDGNTVPLGRVAANGQRPVIVNQILGYISGRGASRTVSMQFGSASTSNFTEASEGSASSTGLKSISAFYANGGTARVRYNFSGSCYFGRDSSAGDTYNGSGFNWSGALSGYVNYVESPAAPAAPTLGPRAGGEMDITWVAPANGGSTITGYRVEIATDAGFTSIVQTLNVGAVLTTRATGLVPGVMYYVRVAAKNAVTDTAGTTSVYSASSNAQTISGGDYFDGTDWSSVEGVFWFKDGVWRLVVPYEYRNGRDWVPVGYESPPLFPA